MSYPGHPRHAGKIKDFNILVGLPADVVKLVKQHLQNGWTLHGETKFFTDRAGTIPLTAVQVVAMVEDEPGMSASNRRW